ncbi:hypothetical protein FA13DRAFT_351757 [Coprinellus micaceus]|uniref:Uncharacterized protein n=1 Tax=Coprinellus micaceus TaxID=71717 RepID=A0A4Y7TCC9_COPMI|nr:hypothetical protein FA13DRAFT_351757 [Coprinellus micaceus]
MHTTPILRNQETPLPIPPDSHPGSMPRRRAHAWIRFAHCLTPARSPPPARLQSQNEHPLACTRTPHTSGSTCKCCPDRRGHASLVYHRVLQHPEQRACLHLLQQSHAPRPCSSRSHSGIPHPARVRLMHAVEVGMEADDRSRRGIRNVRWTICWTPAPSVALVHVGVMREEPMSMGLSVGLVVGLGGA